MPAFPETQAAFAKALFDAARPAPADIVRPGTLSQSTSQTKRFDVYRNNVVKTSIDALSETFPVVERLVGEEFFRATARSFFDEGPPTSPILTHIGAGFADFLDRFPPAAQLPYLGDIARIEQARVQAHHGADATPITIATLAEIDPELVGGTTLTFHPTVTLIRSRFPVGSIWATSSDLIQEKAIDMKKGEDVIVLRPNLQVETSIVPQGGGTFLRTLMASHSIENAAQAGSAESEDFDLSIHLTGCFALGAIVAAHAPAVP